MCVHNFSLAENPVATRDSNLIDWVFVSWFSHFFVKILLGCCYLNCSKIHFSRSSWATACGIRLLPLSSIRIHITPLPDPKEHWPISDTKFRFNFSLLDKDWGEKMNSKDWSSLLKNENGTLGTISIKRRYLQYFDSSPKTFEETISSLQKATVKHIWAQLQSKLN